MIETAPGQTSKRDEILRDTGFSLLEFLSHIPDVGPDPQVFLQLSRFCNLCGSSKSSDLAGLRNQPERLVCPECGSTHHRSPRIVVRCVAESEGQVLLCQRADQPRRMRWSTPGGYLELGEDTHAAAVRETEEEVGITVDSVSLAAVYEFPQINEILMMCTASFRRNLITLSHETMDAKLFAPEEIPWNALAFPSDSEILHRFCDLPRGTSQSIHYATFLWGSDGRIMVRER
jgi:ADP-ribose pyrophosphatase YjhB (NUDIX family)